LPLLAVDHSLAKQRARGRRTCLNTGGLMKKTFRPGQTAIRSGQYEIIGQRGGETGKEHTVVKGEPLPPTPKAGQKYVLVDKTRN